MQKTTESMDESAFFSSGLAMFIQGVKQISKWSGKGGKWVAGCRWHTKPSSVNLHKKANGSLKMLILPPNGRSLLQLIDQGIIECMKCH